jgi:dihydroxyacetone kinase DhaKLM complex PTS-EIIA-like component DhaM
VVGIVIVSHSKRLADAAVELALQMVRGTPPPIEVAAGLDDHVLGTDAARVKEAIDRVASPDGVVVMMDLGSAVLSAELALELRGETDDSRSCCRTDRSSSLGERWPAEGGIRLGRVG